MTAIAPHGFPGEALTRLAKAHRALIGARVAHGEATRRCERSISPAAFNEMDAAHAKLVAAEYEAHQALVGYGMAMGLIDPEIGTVAA